MIVDDNVIPINVDEDEEEDSTEKPKVEKPSKDVISPSLLSRIETELPKKLNKENE